MSVQHLEIAAGLKELLQKSGFHTVQSVTESSEQEIANSLGIETHVARIITDEARNFIKRSDEIKRSYRD